MIRINISLFLLSLFLSGCILQDQKQSSIDINSKNKEVTINYYANNSVTSLEVPPDLTSPSYENSFRLSEFASGIDTNMVNLTNSEIENNDKKILVAPSDISVKKSGNRRWLEVNKDSETIWKLSNQFLKELGFTIKNSNKKIGIMETNFLENRKPEIPAQTMGFFRSALQATIENVNYTLPSVDKYKIRIEPKSDFITEVYLSVNSMAEVISGSGNNETTLWQNSEKDYALEAEMLYKLMVYLGGDSAKAREKIISAKENNKVVVNVKDGLNGYAKLVFNLNLIDTWDNISWAISETNVQVEDRDIKERAFYINLARTADKGIMSKIFGEDAILNTYQIQLKSIGSSLTEVYFQDISEANEQKTKEFSYDFFNQLQKLF